MSDETRGLKARAASAWNAGLGALLILLPWVLGLAPGDAALTRSCAIVGTLILICGALRALWQRASAALSGANIALGIWTLMSSLILAHTLDTGYEWLSMLIGAAVMVLATWSTTAPRAEGDSQHDSQHV